MASSRLLNNDAEKVQPSAQRSLLDTACSCASAVPNACPTLRCGVCADNAHACERRCAMRPWHRTQPFGRPRNLFLGDTAT
mmetsp:Transcript_40745/g.85330  ORF Transcript_40745/g.85330 Transcript_40745/m.85330 type:complete len:81 (-) Transcript_40745:113-355(-)